MTIKQNNLIIALSISFLFFSSCKEHKAAKITEDKSKPEKQNVVEVITNTMEFVMADTIQSGWTTLEYTNNSKDPHFFILEKMPDTLGIYTYRKELFPPFVSAFELFQQGEFEAGMKEFEKIPQWFYNVELAGGVGLTSGQTKSTTTIFLEPGTYVMECYVRMPDGLPHTFMGMVKQLIVTKESNENSPPESDYNIDISTETGITFLDSLSAGSYIFSANFKDQKQYEHFMGHDVNLVRIENDSLVTSLDKWLNTADFNAFRTPSPEGIKFLGGVEDLPAGKTGYFEANLEKGTHILISEIPNAVERNMYKTFTVH